MQMEKRSFHSDALNKATRKSQSLIIVLAMHRSGSSAVTRGLEALGVDLGDRLMPPVPANNETGFWEDIDINRLNQRLLRQAGSFWDALAPIDEAAFKGPGFSTQRLEANQLLSEKIAGADIFAFKDPRTVLLMPFWRQVIDDLTLDDRYMIVVRNPIECATSLERRDDMRLAKGVMLWAKYIISAIRHTDDRPRVFVSYSNMLKNCEAELTRLARALDLPAPDGARIREYRNQFLSRKRRHHEFSTEDLLRSPFVPPFVCRLSRRLDEAAAAADDFQFDHDEIMEISREYEALSPMLELIDIYRSGASQS